MPCGWDPARTEPEMHWLTDRPESPVEILIPVDQVDAPIAHGGQARPWTAAGRIAGNSGRPISSELLELHRQIQMNLPRSFAELARKALVNRICGKDRKLRCESPVIHLKNRL